MTTSNDVSLGRRVDAGQASMNGVDSPKAEYSLLLKSPGKYTKHHPNFRRLPRKLPAASYSPDEMYRTFRTVEKLILTCVRS